MKEIKLHYTEALLRQALRESCFPRVILGKAWCVPFLLLSLGCFVLLNFILLNQHWVVVVLSNMAAVVVLDFARNHSPTMLETMAAFRAGRYERWTLSYTEEELTVSAESFSHTTPWKFISMATQRPTYWILDRAHSEPLLLPMNCLDAEDREFITRKTQTAISV